MTCDRLVVISSFLHHKIKSRYNWNIVESGVKHHNPYPQYTHNSKFTYDRQQAWFNAVDRRFLPPVVWSQP